MVSGILGFLVIIGGAALVLLARRKDLALETAEKNVKALKDLMATRDIQLADKSRDLEVLSSEHKQLIQVGIKEVVSGWQAFASSTLLRDNIRLKAELEQQKVICSQCQLFIEKNMVRKPLEE